MRGFAIASVTLPISNDGRGNGRIRKITVPGVGTFGALYARDSRSHPGRVCLVSKSPGFPLLSSELLCATLNERPVLFCMSQECDAFAGAFVGSGGTIVVAERDDAVFISQMMRVPLVMVDSVSESGDAAIVEIR